MIHKTKMRKRKKMRTTRTKKKMKMRRRMKKKTRIMRTKMRRKVVKEPKEVVLDQEVAVIRRRKIPKRRPLHFRHPVINLWLG